MRILYCSSEIAPFVKTGGLADVASALPQALTLRGHDVRLTMPGYSAIEFRKKRPRWILKKFNIYVNGKRCPGKIGRIIMDDKKTPVYLVAQDELFNRSGLYGETGRDYADNHIRFAFYCHATLKLLKKLDWRPDVIICNDWQTALIPVFLRNWDVFRADAFYRSINTMFVIHNLGYQGLFPQSALGAIGLPDDLFHMRKMEFYGRLSLIKGGLIYSDYIATVSEQYAREIQTEEYGFGLDGLLRENNDRISGIMNGIDGELWNPESDPYLPKTYHARKMSGKKQCKQNLQKKCGLTVDPAIPLVGIVSRFASQKGLDLIQKAGAKFERLKCQWVILGAGDKIYETLLTEMSNRHPKQIYVRLGFDEQLAHRIYAGCDAFLIPSRYEPCGLTQLYAMRYGTVPIARRTGGLIDSIQQATKLSIKKDKGTGFLFTQYTPEAMLAAVRKALKTKVHHPDLWNKIQCNGMSKDFTWGASAESYERLLQSLISTEG